jgi:hypothetical protein
MMCVLLRGDEKDFLHDDTGILSWCVRNPLPCNGHGLYHALPCVPLLSRTEETSQTHENAFD